MAAIGNTASIHRQQLQEAPPPQRRAAGQVAGLSPRFLNSNDSEANTPTSEISWRRDEKRVPAGSTDVSLAVCLLQSPPEQVCRHNTPCGTCRAVQDRQTVHQAQLTGTGNHAGSKHRMVQPSPLLTLA